MGGLAGGDDLARLFLLAALTMLAFAANSILNRAALADGQTGPAAFAAIRTVSGAFCLAGIVYIRSGLPRLIAPGRWIGTGALVVYMLGFSFAYIALDAGVGALILFGGVQITMFAGALLAGERPPAARWIGAIVAFSGLVWLLWPAGAARPDVTAALMMTLAALGWGVYSLAGKGATDALGDTAANFILAAPFTLIVWLALPDAATARGIALAMIAGAITSGLGYALWYTLLPRIASSAAALAQLTVPVIAMAGGALLLSEAPTLRLILAGIVVLGGVAYGVVGAQRTRSSSGS
ncbi:MAG: DMT family transporter [Silicimonas sp.]|nr:DMT family transporter [Silicimonas sp.]